MFASGQLHRQAFVKNHAQARAGALGAGEKLPQIHLGMRQRWITRGCYESVQEGDAWADTRQPLHAAYDLGEAAENAAEPGQIHVARTRVRTSTGTTATAAAQRHVRRVEWAWPSAANRLTAGASQGPPSSWLASFISRAHRSGSTRNTEKRHWKHSWDGFYYPCDSAAGGSKRAQWVPWCWTFCLVRRPGEKQRRPGTRLPLVTGQNERRATKTKTKNAKIPQKFGPPESRPETRMSCG